MNSINSIVPQYPASYINDIPYTNMSMRVPPGRSYKFYTGTPVFPFGFGLSYTTFEMKWYKLLLFIIYFVLKEKPS